MKKIVYLFSTFLLLGFIIPRNFYGQEMRELRIIDKSSSEPVSMVVFKYGDQTGISSAFGETETPSFTLIDLSSSFQINPTLKIKGGIQNLLNENYYEQRNRSVRDINSTPIYAPGRNFYLSLNISFD